MALSRPALTAQRLWLLFLVASAIGIALSLFAVVQKTAGRKTTVDQVVAGSDPISRAIERPIVSALIWLGETVGKKNATWHNPGTRGHNRFYIRYAAMNGLIVLALILFRRRTQRRLDRCLDWMRVPDHQGPRRLIFATALFMALTYQTKAMSGFWFPGIAGWNYYNREPRLSDQRIEPNDTFRQPTESERAFLRTAILDDNLHVLRHAGWIEGVAMMLHYRDGTVLPANLELVDLVFYRYIHGIIRRPDKRTDPAKFVAAVKRTLAARYADRQMFLPLALAYPNHCPYMTLPYEAYPDPAQLEAITFWELILEVSPEGHFSIDAVKLTNEYGTGV